MINKNKLDLIPRSSYRLFAFLPTIFITICLIGIGIYADHLNSSENERNLRQSVFNQLSVIRARLEGNINSNAHLVQGLVAAISVEPNMSNHRFTALAQPLFWGTSQLRNIGAAPKLVIRYMYPVKGNEAAIGLNYRNNPAQFDQVKRARDSGELVLAGPVNLVQGGWGFIARIPVFLAKGHKNGEKFWGIISAVIDVEKLYEASGLLDNQDNIEMAIRGKDALGEKGDVFYGRDALFAMEPELVDVVLPSGSWQMAAVPKAGWSSTRSDTLKFRFLLVIIGLFILLPFLFLARFLEKKRKSDERFMHLFNTIPIPVGIVNNSGEIEDLNSRFVQIFGYTREDIPTIEHWWQRAYPDPAYRRWVLETWGAAARQAEDNNSDIVPNEYQVNCKDGQVRTMEVSGTSLGDSILATFFDVTQRKQSEEALRQERDRAQRYLDTVQVVMVSLDSKGNIEMINREGCELLGYEENELLGQNWFERCLPAPEGMHTVYPVFQQIISGQLEIAREYENTVLCRDGSERLIAWQNAFFKDDTGKITGVLSSGEDITERKKDEQALIAARDEAERANQAKSEFLSSMSHELRTPMNAILGFSQILQMEDLTEANMDLVNEIRYAGEHLLDLINDVLDLAKIEAGRMELSIEPVVLEDVIKKCLSLIQPLVDKQDINIHVEHSNCKSLTVSADAIRLRQVLLNLLSNAIKYNRPGGEVFVHCESQSNDTVRLEVRDTGQGINARKKTELFTSFNRLGAERSHIEGTGIGLVITKNLVELMGGEINFESEPGVGSKFWITLPCETSETISAPQ